MSNEPSQPAVAAAANDDDDDARVVARLQGPVLVLGGSGFVGASLALAIRRHRTDVFATATRAPAWRLEGVPASHVWVADLLVERNLDRLLDEVRPRTVFNCIAYGAYSFETDARLIYETNFNFVARLLERLAARDVAAYVHAGSSSEYGDNCSGPPESSPTAPNSDYAVSKVAASKLIHFYGKRKGLRCANLRLYSVYGPREDASRLVPAVVREGLEGRYPPFVSPEISRDFVYVDDVSDAFCRAAVALAPADFGESFNVGTGRQTTIAQVAAVAAEVFGISAPPAFDMPPRRWDVAGWYANADKARERLGWAPRVGLREGLRRTADWYRRLPDKPGYRRSSKEFGLDTKHSVTAVVACYRDAQAIPPMYDRLRATFARLNVDYEIVFVNDCSPDDSEEVIRRITRDDRRVVGVSHSRNFGSQAAFRSGMELATKNAVVLLDGDLQDPPELIERFVEHWRAGYDVAYGRRVKREAPLHMQLAYKAFYRVFDKFSYLRIPHDAGDFALMDRRVVQALLRFPERDLFLRGTRAYAGFRQVGVDYVRPERPFGVTTNNLWRNLGWAKKGILSFSHVPLNILTFLAVAVFCVTVVLGTVQVLARLAFPGLAPRGVTTTLVVILFFGSVNLIAVALLGEYVAKIFEEVKRRPLFIRRSIVRDGTVFPAAEEPRVPDGPGGKE